MLLATAVISLSVAVAATPSAPTTSQEHRLQSPGTDAAPLKKLQAVWFNMSATSMALDLKRCGGSASCLAYEAQVVAYVVTLQYPTTLSA
jgi:hypothetical protein